MNETNKKQNHLVFKLTVFFEIAGKYFPPHLFYLLYFFYILVFIMILCLWKVFSFILSSYIFKIYTLINPLNSDPWWVQSIHFHTVANMVATHIERVNLKSEILIKNKLTYSVVLILLAFPLSILKSLYYSFLFVIISFFFFTSLTTHFLLPQVRTKDY